MSCQIDADSGFSLAHCLSWLLGPKDHRAEGLKGPRAQGQSPAGGYHRPKTFGKKPKGAGSLRRPTKAEGQRPTSLSKAEDPRPKAEDRKPKTKGHRPREDTRGPKAKGLQKHPEAPRWMFWGPGLMIEIRSLTLQGRRPATGGRMPQFGSHLSGAEDCPLALDHEACSARTNEGSPDN